MVTDRRILGHDNLGGFTTAEIGELTVVVTVGKIVTSANTSSNTTVVDADRLETKSVAGSQAPSVGVGLGSKAIVAGSIGNGLTSHKAERMVGSSHHLIAVTTGSGNGNSMRIGGTNPGDEETEIDTQGANGEGKRGKGVVDILETTFDQITGGSIQAGCHLTDGISERIVGGGLFAGSHIEITPVDNIIGGDKVLA